MSDVFDYIDRDGDALRVRPINGMPDQLVFETKEDDLYAFLPMDKPDIERLYNALGEWLYGSLDEYDAEAIAFSKTPEGKVAAMKRLTEAMTRALDA